MIATQTRTGPVFLRAAARAVAAAGDEGRRS
jgi:hypothetical protein